MMGCPHPQTVADLLDGRIEVTPALAAHLESCTRCREVRVRVAGAREALRAIAEVVPPVPSSPRIEAALRWTRPSATERLPARWVLGAALAGAVAALLMAWPKWGPSGPSSHRQAAGTVASLAAHQAPLEAIVNLLGGRVLLVRGDASPVPLALSTRLHAADRLITPMGGRVAFQWAEGSGALVDTASELALARLDPRAQELALARGRLSVRVGPHQPGESLRVLTPDHSVSVHGTWFTVIADARGTTVEVLEGVVEVAALAGDTSATRLAAPQRAFFLRGKGLTEGAHTLSGQEAERLRRASEMGLVAAWASIDRLLEGSGALHLAATPPAELVVDGVPFGATPLALRRSRTRHLVELSRPGFVTLSRWVAVGPEPEELRLGLRPEPPRAVPPDPEGVRAIIAQRQRAISGCYERRLKRDPGLAGTVTLEIQIGLAGQVVGTAVKEDTLTDPGVASCLRHEAAGWLFPRARNVTISYPFVFRTPSELPIEP